jgi:hypothetical protein
MPFDKMGLFRIAMVTSSAFDIETVKSGLVYLQAPFPLFPEQATPQLPAR